MDREQATGGIVYRTRFRPDGERADRSPCSQWYLQQNALSMNRRLVAALWSAGATHPGAPGDRVRIRRPNLTLGSAQNPAALEGHDK